MKDVYIGLGSNLDHPLLQIVTAQNRLSKIPQTTCIAHSTYYRTPPLGAMLQPSYINAVSLLRSTLSAEEILAFLQDIENQHGRQRDKYRWQARTLDLDLLLYGEEVINSENLTVPHYAMTQRNFVIFPLLELNPEVIIPGAGKAAEIATMLNRSGLVAVTPDEMEAVRAIDQVSST
jgi:2-amino-4-hydroxy-6-hydroxymethyldihydropteridine diphosphokinase